MGNFFIVATPIGNLGDISLRALEILKNVDFILCEDTRVTEKLLSHYDIKKPVLSYHQHSELKRVKDILDLLKSGKNLALVSDAGTPGIADPGNKLVSQIIAVGQQAEGVKRGKGATPSSILPSDGHWRRGGVREVPLSMPGDVNIIPIPGACALTAAASVAGFNMDKFVFMGFPPAKNKRKKFFEKVISSEYPVIFYESTYKILKALEELKNLSSGLEIAVFRELTKKFETIYRGKIGDVLETLKTGETRGEFAVVVKNR